MNAKQEYKEAYRRVRISSMNTPSWREIDTRNLRLLTCKQVHVWMLKAAYESHFNGHYVHFK